LIWLCAASIVLLLLLDGTSFVDLARGHGAARSAAAASVAGNVLATLGYAATLLYLWGKAPAAGALVRLAVRVVAAMGLLNLAAGRSTSRSTSPASAARPPRTTP
jgi:hypothetical protein